MVLGRNRDVISTPKLVSIVILCFAGCRLADEV